jgi:4-aminobutyrate aminotransferase/(S)-3-amino-2-methylpropionate transaminase
MPARFLQKIRDLCTKHGIVMIADEIQCGFGRTGKLFAIEHAGVAPDMITMAKSLGSGMPISAVTGRADLMDAPHLGAIGGTYGGSPVAAVAALRTLEIINTPEFMARATAVGEQLRLRLEAWKARFGAIGDVRGVGAMRVVEFVKDRTTKVPDPDLALKIIREGVAGGLVLIRAGLFSNCIRLLPPIVITDEQLAEGLEVLESAIAKHAG